MKPDRMEHLTTPKRGTEACLAIDFGAGSGRVIAGVMLDNGDISLDEIHRFANRQVRLGDTLHWDFPALYAEMCEGIRRAVDKGYHVLSVGIDTWGVDFGLITANGSLVGNPICYRDTHTEGWPDKLFASHDEKLAQYQTTGTYPGEINTLYQLAALQQREPQLLASADRLLFMPDLFAYYLTGVASCELTIASTSELLLAGKAEWHKALIRQLDLPEKLFGQIVPAGTVKGKFLPQVARQLGLDSEAVVMAVGSHDTASAVYASHATHRNPSLAFLSSGTWSLLGKELDKTVCTVEAYAQGYTNEAGAGGSNCLLQNIPGMWILQNLVKKWQAQGVFAGYDKLMDEAEKATVSSTIDVDAPVFVAPDDMEQAITAYCTASGQDAPQSPADYARVAIRSLAQRYAKAIAGMNAILAPAERPRGINIVGGGCRNRFLNRLTEEATGLPVIAGPVEASAIGNLLLQYSTLANK